MVQTSLLLTELSRYSVRHAHSNSKEKYIFRVENWTMDILLSKRSLYHDVSIICILVNLLSKYNLPGNS